MAHGKNAARDIRYGRQGGHWADEFERVTLVDLPKCSVCHLAMALRQMGGMHYGCAETCGGCWRPANNCQCPKSRSKS